MGYPKRYERALSIQYIIKARKDKLPKIVSEEKTHTKEELRDFLKKAGYKNGQIE